MFEIDGESKAHQRLKKENTRLKNHSRRIDDRMGKKRIRRKRQKAKSIKEGNRQVLEQIKQLKGEHPLWGYRCVLPVDEIPAGVSSKQEADIPAYERKQTISYPDKEVKRFGRNIRRKYGQARLIRSGE